jgi:two-component system, LytTR family, sensor kinase
MLEQHLVILLVKLAVAASLASILVRSGVFTRMLLREERTLNQRGQLALAFATVFGLGMAIRIITDSYQAVDLGLEGSFLAGAIGGYVTGLVSGVLISLPGMFGGEYLSMPLFTIVGVLGGLLRDLAPESGDIWRFSPLFVLNLSRAFRKPQERRRLTFHSVFLLAILFCEFLRWTLGHFGKGMVFLMVPSATGADVIARYATTLFAVILPLKIWNSARTEMKLEAQHRLLIQARLDALSSQINPHFLFNTLNTVSSLIRTNPDQARMVILRLSNILRRLLRKHDNFNPLREELSFIDDYLSIEMVRFGPKLQFIKDVDPDTLDRLVPSMLLQPLVENSIKHGLSAKVDGGIIRVRSHIIDGRLRLMVEDDGVGIPEVKLATLLERGIGVSNVNERLKVLFSNDYKMSIDSRPGEGTRTEIEIPELESPALATT